MLRDIRNSYQKNVLVEHELKENPLIIFQEWLDEAIKNKVYEPTAMVLSTIKSGQPDSRVVLLKEIQENGFVFFTNYLGDKSQQIDKNSQVALNFFWPELERQVRILGKAIKVSRQESIDYFNSRPRDSQLGAWASKQSKELASRQELDDQLEYYEEKFKEKPVPMPEHWGGYLVKPIEIEFWQGRPNRLHDRIRYKIADGIWKFVRLQP